jgi:UDP-glucose 4-epimerase
VAIVTRYDSVIDNIRVSDIWRKLHVIEADIRDVDSLKAINDFKPHIIFHCAAYNHVGGSFTYVSESFDVNAKGTSNVLDAYDGYERFIYFSTSEVYGLQDHVPFSEDMSPQPISPYAIGKYGGELYCRMKMDVQKLPITVIRPFNAFGPYQTLRAIIPEMIDICLMDETVCSTSSKQTREFNFVENLVDGFLLAATKEEAIGQIINLGSGEEIAIKDLTGKIHTMTGSQSRVEIGALPHRPTEIWKMCAANQTAQEILGWTPKITFDEGLEKTIDWFRQYKEVFEQSSSLRKLSQ